MIQCSCLPWRKPWTSDGDLRLRAVPRVSLRVLVSDTQMKGSSMSISSHQGSSDSPPVARSGRRRPTTVVRALELVLASLLFTPQLFAQPQIAPSYRRAAQAFRTAALRTRCPQNRVCYEAQAQYHDALAASLAGGSQPSAPTCQVVDCPQDQSGNAVGGSAGSAPATSTGLGSMDPVAASFSALGRQLQGMVAEAEARQQRHAAMEARRQDMIAEWTEIAERTNQYQAEPEYETFSAQSGRLGFLAEPVLQSLQNGGGGATADGEWLAEHARNLADQEQRYLRWRTERAQQMLSEAQDLRSIDDPVMSDALRPILGTFRGECVGSGGPPQSVVLELRRVGRRSSGEVNGLSTIVRWRQGRLTLAYAAPDGSTDGVYVLQPQGNRLVGRGRRTLAAAGHTSEVACTASLEHVSPGEVVPDTDDDGEPDPQDLCPADAAGEHPNPERRGCPDGDGDGDGVLDHSDACPGQPPGWRPDRARAGCPVPDRDGDLVPDAIDHCPDQSGAPHPTAERTGCPGILVASESALTLARPVDFNAHDVPRRAATGALTAVADALQTAPEIRRLSVTICGERQAARAQRRAASVVNWLTAHGVEAERLSVEGVCEDQATPNGGGTRARSARRRGVVLRVRQLSPEVDARIH